MIDLMNLKSLEFPMLGESASPFIDEGDGFTSERERVHKLLSLVAHAVRYKMMAGAHNIVCIRSVWEVLLHSMYGK